MGTGRCDRAHPRSRARDARARRPARRRRGLLAGGKAMDTWRAMISAQGGDGCCPRAPRVSAGRGRPRRRSGNSTPCRSALRPGVSGRAAHCKGTPSCTPPELTSPSAGCRDQEGRGAPLHVHQRAGTSSARSKPSRAADSIGDPGAHRQRRPPHRGARRLDLGSPIRSSASTTRARIWRGRGCARRAWCIVGGGRAKSASSEREGAGELDVEGHSNDLHDGRVDDERDAHGSCTGG